MSLAHPLKDQLIAFGQGKLAPDESLSVETHLEVCPECCETLLDLKDDTFVGLVKVSKLKSVADAVNVGTDPGAVAGSISRVDDSEYAPTLLELPGDPSLVIELPVELREHPRYRIVELIGRGGMGNVYRAEHRLMHRLVAIKLINAQLMQHPQAVERFRREVQTAAKLSHPNIVAAHDAEQAGNAHFLVMEFVEGTDLATVVKQRGPMSVAEACECIRQAAAGLQHAHEKGMVHRDIKPHNLMLASTGQVRILDFGLAGFVSEPALESLPVQRNVHDAIRVLDASTNGRRIEDNPYGATAAHLTMMGSVMGTPDYIAPEQAIDAHSADTRADIYSLGCTLYFLLTGKPPFEADNLIAKLKAHAELVSPSLATVRNDVPSELVAVAAKMMAKKPAERFQTPAEVAVALEPFAKLTASPPQRRWQTLVASAAVLLLLAGVIFVQTDKGRIEIQSDVDDVEVIIKQGGKQVEVLDIQTGSQVKWRSSGTYNIEMKGSRNDIEIVNGGFNLTRWNKAVVTLRRKAPATGLNAAAHVTNQKSKAAGVVEVNLLTDSSFENTGLTQLPRGWRAWLNDGPEFRCEVVAGGHTGQHCLKISGKGTRGVVFANDIQVDRSKRYALKGWAKFEGDKNARAIIKFNYFRGSEFLGVHDLVGVTADQTGWHLLEKTDALDAYPQADHFYAMCHVEGNGSGWFDDLELIAFDRERLPIDFDTRHGQSNRLHGSRSLERWVGAWKTECTYRETVNLPHETKVTLHTTSERTLGNQFLLSYSKIVPSESQNRQPISADSAVIAKVFGGEERLQFLMFDQNAGAFRQWIFSSQGDAFEWRGQWDEAAKSLELRMLPDVSNLFSTERFVDSDRVEAKLWKQFVMGTQDAGRWAAIRQAATAKVDVPVANAPVDDSPELSLLNKFAGDWMIRANSKPSVWIPDGAEGIQTEQAAWVLGGRFLMARSFNDKDQLTTIWLATYEPSEKAYRFWFFSSEGWSGQWRVTWDASSRGFHWRSIDMPSGWIGTGFNRWINDDTFDNQALIKDENGRVLFDGTQDKRRKK